MIATLRDGKAKLSRLVDMASRGEEVVITVRGKPKARLCPMGNDVTENDRKTWANQLREARASYSTGTRDTSRAIIDDIRGDRS